MSPPNALLPSNLQESEGPLMRRGSEFYDQEGTAGTIGFVLQRSCYTYGVATCGHEYAVSWIETCGLWC
jgi:hypothetical protein